MDISIPHLNYTVKVRPFKKPPGSIAEASAWIDRVDKFHCVMYLRKGAKPPTVAHELVHVLQHLCDVRHMGFTAEDEHMGYLMQYLMGRILGYVWVTE